jgi:hypothetical protein
MVGLQVPYSEASSPDSVSTNAHTKSTLTTSLLLLFRAIDRFPLPLFARTVLLGTTFGALEGCLRIAQDKIGRLKEEDERRRRLQEEEEAKEAEEKKEGGSIAPGSGKSIGTATGV